MIVHAKEPAAPLRPTNVGTVRNNQGVAATDRQCTYVI